MPSGRMGGLLCAGLSLVGPWFVWLTVGATNGPNKPYFLLSSVAWAAFFGYLSYWFYSGKANPRFGKFRMYLTMAIIVAFESLAASSVALGEGVKSGVYAWGTMLGIGGMVFFSVGAWKEYRRARLPRQPRS